jgi:hypothetical protein
VGYKLVTRPSVYKIDFEISNQVKKQKKDHVSNYFKNPEKHWGPKRAAAIVMQREPKSPLLDEEMQEEVLEHKALEMTDEKAADKKEHTE